MKNTIKLILLGSVVLCLGLFAFGTIANAATGSWYGDTVGTRAFYNQKATQNGYTLIPTAFDGQGHVSNDVVTAQKMCELAGFNTVVSRDCFEFGTSGRCNFTSCANNVMGVWNTATNNIDLVNSCGHTWLASLTCGNTPLPSVCSTNSQCGTNGLTGSPFCQNSNVYQNYRTYTCSNPGTPNASCSYADNAQLQTTCTANQTCSSGVCVNQNIPCSTNSQCGVSGLTGSSFCQGNSIYKNYKTWTCNNPGTTQSFCSSDISAQLQSNCSANQTCSGGSCVNQNINCSTNSQCGTNGLTGSPFCQSGNVYQNFRTWTCNSPGTTSSSCSHGDMAQLQTTCSANQTCSNGSCVNQNIPCSTNSQCGTNGLTGSPFCQGNGIYQNYTTYTCNNAGTTTASCSNATVPQLQNNCTSSQTCQNGTCVTNQNNLTLSCYVSPTSASVNQSATFYCTASGGNGIYTYSWSGACTSGNSQNCTNTFYNQGTQVATAVVTSGLQTQSQNISLNVTGNSNICTYHAYQRCNNNALYWYDSCGTQQDLSQICPNGCVNNSCQGYSNSTTVQTNSATNIYNNQATLNGYLYNYNTNNNYNNNSCASYVWFQWGFTNSYGYETTHLQQNYTGAFTQNIANLLPGNIYHFRAVAQNCQGNIVYGQDMTFNVVPQVLGASIISTGLTNNFWMDSFLLPLILTLLGIWMLKSGMFFGLEKWFAGKKQNRREFVANTELNKRILSIKRTEQI